jgi:hypothetical protein
MTDQAVSQAGGAGSQAEIARFDLFEDSAQMQLLRDAKPRTIVGLIALGLLAVVLSAIIGHRFGSFSDFQPVADAQRLMQIGDLPPSRPAFPLMRDVVSWYLVVMSAATLVITRRQWQLITEAVPHLSKAGVLYWLSHVSGGKGWHRTLVGSTHADDAPANFLDAAFRHARRLVTATGHYWYAIFIVAVVVAAGFTNGEIDGSFGALAPLHLSGTAEQEWLHRAISSWWASPSNPNGLLVYFLISALMFSAIAAQNAVGLAAIYVFVVMSRTFEFRCNWTQDGDDRRYGWSPVAALYRITLLSLVLHIAAITSVMWLMGWGRFAYMTILIVIPVIAVPLYIILPAIIFTRFGQREKKRRIEELDRELLPEGVGGTQKIENLKTLRDETAFVEKARINPLRPRKREIPAVVATILIPITLTAVQVIAALK